MSREERDSKEQLEKVYQNEKPRFLSRLRAAGKTWEEAEDLVQDVYTQAMSKIPFLHAVQNLPAWINTLLTRRIVDVWRHDKVVVSAGQVDVGEETIAQIIAGAGLDPLESYVRDCLLEALDDAMAALPPNQKWIIEAQVFGGRTFRELALETGESIDTLMARKRYAVAKLSYALRHWIEDED